MVLNIIISLLIWGTSLVVLMSILVTGGLPLPAGWTGKTKRKFSLSFLDKSGQFQNTDLPSKKDYMEIFGFAFAFRVLMVFFAAAAIALFMQEETLSLQAFWDKFVLWDATSYVNIAKGGYTEYLENGEPITLVFFPLYSMLIKPFMLFIRNVKLAGLITSALCYSVGCCFMYAYTARSYGKGIAGKAVLYLSISPFGFFFGTLMTESTFFMMICICLYLLAVRKWWSFALAGILCSLARMQGVLIIIPACIHWFEEYKPISNIRKKNWKALWQDVYKRLVFVPLPIVGTFIYFYINRKIAGNPFAFMDYQRRYWGHGYQYIGKAMKLNMQNALTGDLSMIRISIWIPQLFFFVLAVGLSVYGVKRHENKLLAYLLAYTVASYSLDWLISGSRYMLCAVPMWIFLGELGHRYPRLDRAVTILSPILMGIYMVAYFGVRQVM